MNHTHNANHGQVSAFIKLLAVCLLPVALIFAFTSLGIEQYSIGGFIPYLMLLFCPIAYLMMAYPRMSKQRIIDNIKKKLNQ